MKPFYEKQEGKLHIHCSNNLSFPEHLHEHIEVLYLLEGELTLTVSETSYLMTKGPAQLFFLDRFINFSRKKRAGFIF